VGLGPGPPPVPGAPALPPTPPLPPPLPPPPLPPPGWLPPVPGRLPPTPPVIAAGGEGSSRLLWSGVAQSGRTALSGDAIRIAPCFLIDAGALTARSATLIRV